MPKISLTQISHWFFYCFLFLLFLNQRKIFNFSAIQNFPGFRENFSYSFYLFDLFLLFGIIYVLFRKLKNKKLLFSSFDTFEKIIFILFILLLFEWFLKPTLISGYALWRIFLASGLFFWIKQLNQDKLENNFFQNSLKIIFGSGIFQTILASLQFFYQKSLGLSFLGESILAREMLGVAKIELIGQKFIRAYGTFPHPNLLAVFLFFSFASGIYLVFYYHKKNLLQFAGLCFLLWGIFLTFSRSVWLITALFCLFLVVKFFLEEKYFLKTTIVFLKNTSLKNRPRKIFLSFFVVFLLGLIFFLFPFFRARFCLSCTNDPSFTLRKEYLQTAKIIILENPLNGVGLGNFTLILPKIQPEIRKTPWHIQPIHNLYLLATAESGLWIIIFFVLLFFFSLKNFYQKKNYFSLIFLFFLLLGFFDHYFWTLAQGQLIFFLALAFSVYCCKMEKL